MSTNTDEKKKLESIEDQRKRVEEEKHIWKINEEINRLGGRFRIRLREAKRCSSNRGPGEKWEPRWVIYWDPGS
jgi:hypothetical protein